MSGANHPTPDQRTPVDHLCVVCCKRTYENVRIQINGAWYCFTCGSKKRDGEPIQPTESPDTYPAPEHGWTCFHCGETFTHPNAARLHFGPTPHDEPKCTISAHRLRAMEAELARYRDEDSDLHRALAAKSAEMARAVREAEELGYSRGLRDSGHSRLSVALQNLIDEIEESGTRAFELDEAKEALR